MSRQPTSIPDCSRSPEVSPRRWNENRRTYLEEELFPSALGNAVMVKLRETRLALDNCSRVTLTKYLKLDVKSCTDVFEVAQKLYSSSLNHVECTAKLVRALLCTRGLGHLVSTCFSPGYSNPPAVRDMILHLRGLWSKFAEFIGLPPETVDKLNDIGHQQTHDHEIVHVFMKLFPIPNVEDIDCILREAFRCATMTLPTYPQLLNLPSDNGMINIAKAIGINYKLVGTALLQDKYGTIIPSIERECSITQDRNMEILRRWVQGEGMACTWWTLVRVLKCNECIALAEDITLAILSREQMAARQQSDESSAVEIESSIHPTSPQPAPELSTKSLLLSPMDDIKGRDDEDLGIVPEQSSQPAIMDLGIVPEQSSQPAIMDLGIVPEQSSQPAIMDLGIVPEQSSQPAIMDLGIVPEQSSQPAIMTCPQQQAALSEMQAIAVKSAKHDALTNKVIINVPRVKHHPEKEFQDPESVITSYQVMNGKEEILFIKEMGDESNNEIVDMDTRRQLNRLVQRLNRKANGATSTQLIPLLIQLSQTLQLAPGISPLARVETAMVILSEFFGATLEVQHLRVTTTDTSSQTSQRKEQHDGSMSPLQSGKGSHALKTQRCSLAHSVAASSTSVSTVTVGSQTADQCLDHYAAASSSSLVSTATVGSLTADRVTTPSPGPTTGQLSVTVTQIQDAHPTGTVNSSPLEATLSSQTSVPVSEESQPSSTESKKPSKEMPLYDYSPHDLYEDKKCMGEKKGSTTQDAGICAHSASTAGTANHYFLLVLCPDKITLNHEDYGHAITIISQTKDDSDTAEKKFKDYFPYQRYTEYYIKRKWVGFGEEGVARIKMESNKSDMTINSIDTECQILRDDVDEQDEPQKLLYTIKMKDTINNCAFCLHIEIGGISSRISFSLPVKCTRECAQPHTKGDVPRDGPLHAQVPREAMEEIATKIDNTGIEMDHIPHPATGEESASDDLLSVSSHLLHLSPREIWSLGLVLGLYPSTLQSIRKSDTFLDDMLLAWLSMDGSNWMALVNGLRDQRLKLYELAETIEEITVKHL